MVVGISHLCGDALAGGVVPDTETTIEEETTILLFHSIVVDSVLMSVVFVVQIIMEGVVLRCCRIGLGVIDHSSPFGNRVITI